MTEFKTVVKYKGHTVDCYGKLKEASTIIYAMSNGCEGHTDNYNYETGEHFLDLTLGSGSYAHDVDISQTGTGNHAARVDLDGFSTDFDLNQQGSTDQDYNIDMTCGVQAGCTLSTTQGN